MPSTLQLGLCINSGRKALKEEISGSFSYPVDWIVAGPRWTAPLPFYGIVLRISAETLLYLVNFHFIKIFKMLAYCLQLFLLNPYEL